MTKLIRVARDGNSVIVQKSDGWYSVINSESQIVNTGDSLDALTASGSWRRPVESDVNKYRGVSAALEADQNPNRIVRVPKAVKELIRNAAAVETNRKNVPFLLQFSSKESVTIKDVNRLAGIIDGTRRNVEALSAEDTVSWIDKIVNPEPLVAAASFEPSDDLDYFVASDREDSTEINELYALTEDFTLLRWDGEEFVEVEMDLEEFEAPTIIEIDEDTAQDVANWIENGREGDYIDVARINPDEYSLFMAAMPDLDLEHLDRVTAVVADATGYSDIERSANAERQVRSPEGKFDGPQEPVGTKLTSFNKARLPEEMNVILDPARRIEEYASSVKSSAQEAAISEEAPPVAGDAEASEAPRTASEPAGPLYVAVVDDVDRTAVLDVLAIKVENDETVVYARSGGEWVLAPDVIDQLRSVTPPAIVELDDEELIKEVLAQVDANDAEGGPDSVLASGAEFKDYSDEERTKLAEKGWAMPNGSFPIQNIGDLENAVQSYGRAKEEDRAKVRAHIVRRAKALNRRDLIPTSWMESFVLDYTAVMDDSSPLFDEFGLIAAGIPGIADTPSDIAAVNRLRRYWTWGPGAAKIRWGAPGDLTRCNALVSKYMPGRGWGYCQERHKDRFGIPNPESGGR